MKLRFSIIACILLLSACGVSNTPLRSAPSDGSSQLGSQSLNATGNDATLADSGHLICISGQSENAVRVLRPSAAADTFPSSYYLEESGFPLTEISDVTGLNVNSDHMTLFLSASASKESFTHRYIYAVNLDLRKRNYTLRRLSELPGRKSLVRAASPIAVALENGNYLVPHKTPDSAAWAVWNGETLSPTRFSYPDLLRPQYHAGTRVLSFLAKDGKRKFFQGEKEITPASESSEQIDGEVFDQGFWWVEKTLGIYRLALFREGKLENTALPLRENDQVVQALSLSSVGDSYRVTLLVKSTTGIEARDYLWNIERRIADEALTVAFPAHKAARKEVLSSLRYIFSREESESGEEFFLRYSRGRDGWERLNRMSCSVTSYAPIGK